MPRQIKGQSIYSLSPPPPTTPPPLLRNPRPRNPFFGSGNSPTHAGSPAESPPRMHAPLWQHVGELHSVPMRFTHCARSQPAHLPSARTSTAGHGVFGQGSWFRSERRSRKGGNKAAPPSINHTLQTRRSSPFIGDQRPTDGAARDLSERWIRVDRFSRGANRPD